MVSFSVLICIFLSAVVVMVTAMVCSMILDTYSTNVFDIIVLVATPSIFLMPLWAVIALENRTETTLEVSVKETEGVHFVLIPKPKPRLELLEGRYETGDTVEVRVHPEQVSLGIKFPELVPKKDWLVK